MTALRWLELFLLRTRLAAFIGRLLEVSDQASYLAVGCFKLDFQTPCRSRLVCLTLFGILSRIFPIHHCYRHHNGLNKVRLHLPNLADWHDEHRLSWFGEEHGCVFVENQRFLVKLHEDLVNSVVAWRHSVDLALVQQIDALGHFLNQRFVLLEVLLVALYDLVITSTWVRSRGQEL